jgi:hypothetical protein
MNQTSKKTRSYNFNIGCALSLPFQAYNWSRALPCLLLVCLDSTFGKLKDKPQRLRLNTFINAHSIISTLQISRVVWRSTVKEAGASSFLCKSSSSLPGPQHLFSVWFVYFSCIRLIEGKFSARPLLYRSKTNRIELHLLFCGYSV